MLDIPIIDISQTNSEEVGEQLVSAAAKYGFIYIKSVGLNIDAGNVDQIFGIVGYLRYYMCDILLRLGTYFLKN